MARKPILQNRNMELTLAIMLLLAGFVFLWDSTDNRNHDAPWFLRWLTFW